MINTSAVGINHRELLNPQLFSIVKDKCVKPKIQAWYKPGRWVGGAFPNDWSVHINKSTVLCFVAMFGLFHNFQRRFIVFSILSSLCHLGPV